MAKDKNAVSRPFVAEMFQAGIYKRNQGRIARQVTFFAVAIVIAVGCYRMADLMSGQGVYVQYGVPLAVAVLGWWISFRAVNVSSFADFLISVEAEMTKVSWPTRADLLKASLVVLLFIIVLAAILFVYDNIWTWFFTRLGVL